VNNFLLLLLLFAIVSYIFALINPISIFRYLSLILLIFFSLIANFYLLRVIYHYKYRSTTRSYSNYLIVGLFVNLIFILLLHFFDISNYQIFLRRYFCIVAVYLCLLSYPFVYLLTILSNIFVYFFTDKPILFITTKSKEYKDIFDLNDFLLRQIYNHKLYQKFRVHKPLRHKHYNNWVYNEQFTQESISLVLLELFCFSHKNTINTGLRIITTCSYSSIKKYVNFEKSTTIFTPGTYIEAFFLIIKGNELKLSGEYDLAEKYFLDAIDILSEIDNKIIKEIIFRYCYQCGDFYIYQGEYEKAEQLLNEFYDISEDTKDRQEILSRLFYLNLISGKLADAELTGKKLLQFVKPVPKKRITNWLNFKLLTGNLLLQNNAMILLNLSNLYYQISKKARLEGNNELSENYKGLSTEYLLTALEISKDEFFGTSSLVLFQTNLLRQQIIRNIDTAVSNKTNGFIEQSKANLIDAITDIVNLWAIADLFPEFLEHKLELKLQQIVLEKIVFANTYKQYFSCSRNEVSTWINSIQQIQYSNSRLDELYKKSWKIFISSIFRYREAAYIIPLQKMLIVEQYLWLARIFLELGIFDEARKSIKKSIQILSTNRNVELLIESYFTEGLIYETSNELENAFNSYSDAINLIEDVRGKLKLEESKIGHISKYQDIYKQMVMLCLKMNRIEDAFNFVERAKSRILIDLLANVKIRLTDIDPADPDAEKERQLRERLDRLFALLRNIEGSKYTRSVLMKKDCELLNTKYEQYNNEFAETTNEYNKLVKKLQQKHPQWSSLQYVDVLRLNEFQKMLPEDTCFIEYFITDDYLIAFVIDKKHIHIAGSRNKLKISDIITYEGKTGKEKLKNIITDLKVLIAPESRDVNTYIYSLADEGIAKGKTADWSIRESYLSKALYQLLIAPIEQWIKQYKRLIISPYDILHNIPFQVLWDGSCYLIDKYEISYVPSGTVLKYCQRTSKQSKHTKYLGFANSRPVLHNMSELKFANAEIISAASLYHPAEYYLDKEATEMQFIKSSNHADIIHIACHGDFCQNDIAYSALLLTEERDKTGKIINDGRLTVREIMEQVCLEDSSLVVLSACKMATNSILPGDNLIGMTRAFMYAGAPSIVASLWSVNDESTSILMKCFNYNLSAGMNKTSALRQAQLKIKQDASNKYYVHPYFWAPFVLVGSV